MRSFAELYDKIMEYIFSKIEKGELTDVAYKLWIEKLQPINLDGSTVSFVVPTSFQKDVIVKNYAGLLHEAFINVLGFDVEINISALDEETENPAKKREELEKSFSNAEYDYTFDTFIVGSSNRLAYTFAEEVTKLDRRYNPLFIHGPSGLGKTHLLTAISNKVKKQNPDVKIIYVTGETFTNELVNAIKQKKDTSEFRQKYRTVDVLLFDDVQFIAGKESTQEEFFHTFNELYMEGKQVVLTSDRPPKDIRTFEDRLRSRFEGGIVQVVDPPEFETRLAIVRRKAELLNIKIPDEVSTLIAEKIENNIRQLEGCVKKLKAIMHLIGTPPSPAQAQNVINEILTLDQPSAVTFEKVLSEVSAIYGVTSADILSNKRSAPISLARKVCAYIVKEVTDLSYKEIGAKIGGKDHSTIIYYCDDIIAKFKKEPRLKEITEDVIKNIRI